MNKQFSKLWEESKQVHHKGVEKRSTEFRNEFRKWQFFMQLVGIIFPFVFKKYCAARQPTQKAVNNIVQDFGPKILTALQDREYWFNQWEEENSGPGLSASSDTSVNESKSLKVMVKLCDQFAEELNVVKGYSGWFHPIENPRKLIENPYPGYLSTLRARNYVKHLMRRFC